MQRVHQVGRVQRRSQGFERTGLNGSFNNRFSIACRTDCGKAGQRKCDEQGKRLGQFCLHRFSQFGKEGKSLGLQKAQQGTK
ncbi:MAG: hypothetical protein NXI22_14050, partial [bacterium]|nr:hypothetical protein [bacterium]